MFSIQTLSGWWQTRISVSGRVLWYVASPWVRRLILELWQ